jgi:hypothetical protein
MFLVSTLRNFAKDLSPEQGRERYQAVIDALPVQHLALDARDKAQTLLESSKDALDVVSDQALTEALAAAQLQDLVEKIRQRAFMISPVGEWGALGNYEHRRANPRHVNGDA